MGVAGGEKGADDGNSSLPKIPQNYIFNKMRQIFFFSAQNPARASPRQIPVYAFGLISRGLNFLSPPPSHFRLRPLSTRCSITPTR